MLLRQLFSNPTDSGTLLSPADWLISAINGDGVTAATASKNSNIYTCVNILADDIGKLPIHTFRTGGKKTEGMKHPVAKLLYKRPNPLMTPLAFKRTLQYHMGFYGNAIAYIEWGTDGYPKSLWPLDPTKTTIRLNVVTGTLTYTTSDAKGAMYHLQPHDVLHFYEMSKDGLIGVPKWRTLIDELDSQNAIKKFQSQFYKNGTMTHGVLQAASKINPEAKKKLRQEWEKINGGIDNAGRVAVLDLGMEYKSLGMQLDQAQFIETQKFGINEVAKVYRIPPHKLAQLDRATYANAEAMSLDYIKTTLLPIFTSWEQEINYKLFTESERENYYVKFNAAAELRGDSKARAEYYKDMLYAGIYTLNEIRDMEEMECIGDVGDIHLASLNYTDITVLKDLQLAKAKNGTLKGGDDDGEKGKKNQSDAV